MHDVIPAPPHTHTHHTDNVPDSASTLSQMSCQRCQLPSRMTSKRRISSVKQQGEGTAGKYTSTDQ